MASWSKITLCAILTVPVVARSFASADQATPATDTPAQTASTAVAAPSATADEVAQSGVAPPATADQAAQPANSLQEVTVTGTRVVRQGFESPQPLTEVSTQDLNNEAQINVADTLSELPQMGQASSDHNSGSDVSDGNAGASFLNLLGLGSQRTLVLLNGVRVGASAVQGFDDEAGAVDINEFPTALISRVDVVTGGASSAYGSDAIAGVVNLILDTNFTGLKGSLQGGTSSYGDDDQGQGTLTFGTGFADNRGHLLLSASADRDDGVLDGLDRPWAQQTSYETNEFVNPNYTSTNGQPYYISAGNVGNSQKIYGGLIYGGPLAGIAFGPGGSTYPFTFGTRAIGGASMTGGSYNVNPISTRGEFISMDPALNRENGFGRLSFDITDDINVYAQFDTATTNALTEVGNSSENLTINSGNPFIPASVQSEMTANGISSFPLGVINPVDIESADTRVFDQYLIGATGKLPAIGPSWTWDFYATRSSTTIHMHTLNDTNLVNLDQAANAVTSPTTGQPICASTLTNPNNGCVPYNPMGIGVSNPAAIAYFSQTSWMNQVIAEDAVSATLQGEPVSDWAGPVSLAVGGLYRDESVSSTTTAQDVADDYFVGNYSPTNGSYHTQEGFLETVAPLAKDLPGARSLDFNGAARLTQYSTSGSEYTWKLGLEWNPLTDVRFRLMRSRDIRAPDLGSLFSSGSSEIESVIDPFLNNQSVNTLQVTKGNPALNPEVAAEETGGIVYTPSWFRGFTASFDMYDVRISDSIATSNVQTEIDECYLGVSQFCALIHPGSTPGTLNIDISPTNTAYIKTSGFTLEADYAKQLAGLGLPLPGAVTVRTLLTHVADLTTVDPSGEVIEGAGSNAGLAYTALSSPTWKYDASITYDAKSFSGSWTARGFGPGDVSNQYTQCSTNCPARAFPADAPYYTIEDNHMPGAFYMDLGLTWHWKRETSTTSDVFVVVQNLANKVPNFPGWGTFGNPALYDMLGRVYRAGIRFQL